MSCWSTAVKLQRSQRHIELSHGTPVLRTCSHIIAICLLQAAPATVRLPLPSPFSHLRIVSLPTKHLVHTSSSYRDKMTNSQYYSTLRNNVYLIGDSTFDVGQGLHALLAHSDSPLLHAFFTSASAVLQQEVHGLVSTLRADFPRFSSVQDLVALAREGSLHPALHKALVCIYHLGVFIRYAALAGSSHLCVMTLTHDQPRWRTKRCLRSRKQLLPRGVLYRSACCCHH